MKNAVNRWALKPLPERIRKAHSTLLPFLSPATCGTFYFAVADLANNAEKQPPPARVSADKQQFPTQSVAHLITTVQNSALHFYGEPDFLPTTAGSLC
jgi:hypothetical protein